MPARYKKWIRWSAVLLLVGFLGWAAFYGARRGFVRKWRSVLSHELQEYGIHAKINKLTLDPVRGLLAQGVEIFDASDKKTPIARIREVSLDIDLAALARRGDFLNSVEMRDTMIVIPLEPRNNEGEPRSSVGRAPVSSAFMGVNAKLLFLPKAVHLVQASAFLEGIEIAASGNLVLSDRKKAGKKPRLPELAGRHGDLLRSLLLEIRGLRRTDPAGTSAPKLLVRFDAVEGQPDRLRLEAALDAEKISRGNAHLDVLRIRFDAQDGVYHLRELYARAGDRECMVRASRHIEDSRVHFSVENRLDPLPFLGNFRPDFLPETLVFTDPPHLSLSGEWDPKKPDRTRFVGRLELERFTVREEAFLNLDLSFSVGGKRWLVQDADLGHKSGRLQVGMRAGADDGRFWLLSDIQPRVLLRAAPAPWAEWAESLRFEEPPGIRFQAEQSSDAASSTRSPWRGGGSANLGGLNFRGMRIEAGGENTPLLLEDGEFVAGPIALRAGPIAVQGSLHFDLLKGALRFEKSESDGASESEAENRRGANL